MKLYDMDVSKKIDYLVHGYYDEHEMLDKLIYYTTEEALEKAVKEIIKDGQVLGFEKDE